MRIIFTIAVILGLNIGGAGHVNATYVDGNKLYQNCSVNSNASTYFQESAFCIAYIVGAIDALEAEREMAGKGSCIPSNVTMGQLKDIVVAFLKLNPGKRHIDGYLLVNLAVIESFDCAFSRTKG